VHSDGKKVKMNNNSEPIKYTYIDLFAGCGGLSLGLMKSGWKGLFGIEKEINAFSTLKHNLVDKNDGLKFEWPDWLPVAAHDVTTLIDNYADKLQELRGTVTMVVGGPPCQGFSLRGKRDINDHRNRLFEHYLDIVERVSPTLVLLENVHGIAVPFKQQAGEQEIKKPRPTVADEIADSLGRLNYRVYNSLVDTSAYGIPQTRSRYIMIGVKKNYLSPNNQMNDQNDPFSILEELQKRFLAEKGLSANLPITAQAALSDLERKNGVQKCKEHPRFQEGLYGKPNGSYQLLMRANEDGTISPRKIPDSHRFANHRESTVENFKKLMQCERGIQLSRESREVLGVGNHDTIPLAPNKPCHTLTTLPDDCIHYSEPRIFTVREYARVQSFPDWFEFRGKYTTGGKVRKNECPRYTQVGNAVPPLLGEAIGLALKSFIGKLRLTPDLPKDIQNLRLVTIGGK